MPPYFIVSKPLTCKLTITAGGEECCTNKNSSNTTSGEQTGLVLSRHSVKYAWMHYHVRVSVCVCV